MGRVVAAIFGMAVLPGCWQTLVAGVEQSASGSGAGTEASATDTAGPSCTTATCSEDTTAADACLLPSPLDECDTAADPLRAFEIACYQDVTAASLSATDDDTWRSAHEFGNAFWVSPDSFAMLALTTGRMPAVDPTGQVAFDTATGQPGQANDNPDDASAPAPIDTRPGSNGGRGGSPFHGCDGVGDCSDSLQAAWPDATAHDLVWFSFGVAVPDNARGYALRVALLTAEYPERVASPTSDTFVWWADSETFTGNLATLGSAPANVTGLAPLLTITGDDPALLRTGMDGTLEQACTVGAQVLDPCPIGAATPWMTLVGPAVPGEIIQIVGALFDQGDDQLDTVVLLDGFHWRCDSCTPGVDCGLRVP
ncbi:MAG: hypothetical protein K0V04_05120 [Deltaproteobacteria bacterium]|nr:hypothetical protein [Deltaproteobacteria bacterium]